MDRRRHGAVTRITLKSTLSNTMRVPMKLLTLTFLSVGMAFSQSNECGTPEQCQSLLAANPRVPSRTIGSVSGFFLTTISNRVRMN